MNGRDIANTGPSSTNVPQQLNPIPKPFSSSTQTTKNRNKPTWRERDHGSGSLPIHLEKLPNWGVQGSEGAGFSQSS